MGGGHDHFEPPKQGWGAQVGITRVVGSGIHPDPKVEAWLFRRENLDHHFRWNVVTARRFAIWAVGIPLLMYAGSVAQQVR